MNGEQHENEARQHIRREGRDTSRKSDADAGGVISACAQHSATPTSILPRYRATALNSSEGGRWRARGVRGGIPPG